MRTCGIGGLAYLVVGARDPLGWARYGSEVLGAQVVEDGDEVILRLDERVRRIIVQGSHAPTEFAPDYSAPTA